MKRSLRCHSNREEESSCGTTVRGPCQAADHFRALKCLSVVWKHERDIRSQLAHCYPSITNFSLSIPLFSLSFVFFSCSLPCFAFRVILILLPCCLPSSLIFSPSSLPACLCQSSDETAMADPILARHIRYQLVLIRVSLISTAVHHESAHLLHTHIHTHTRAHKHKPPPAFKYTFK